MKSRITWKSLLWLIFLVACLLFSGWRLLTDPTALSTNLFGLLPETTHSQLQQEALSRSRSAFARQILVLISHKEAAAATKGALAVRQQLLQAGLIDNRSTIDTSKLLKRYHEIRYNLLIPADEQALRTAPKTHFKSAVQARLRSPFQANVTNIALDPGGYLGRYILALPRPYPAFYPLNDKLLASQQNGLHYRLLALQLPASGFSQTGQHAIATGLKNSRSALIKACPDCTLRATGPALFAISARQQAQQETMLLGLAGTLSLIIMLVLVFRSIRPLLYTLGSVFSGVIGAVTLVLAINGSVHILTLVFGTTLLGIGVDYAFHYLVAFWQRDTKDAAVLPLVLPGLTIGLLTSIIAFSFLFFSGFPALRQIALFSCAGLTAAYLTVVLSFPVWLQKSNKPITQRKVHYLSLPSTWQPGSRLRWSALAIAVIIMAIGLPQLSADDDVRNLQPLSTKRLAIDAEIREIIGQKTQPGFFLIQGHDYQQLLRREENLQSALQSLAPQAELLGLSQFIPSLEQQKDAQQLWHQILNDEGYAWPILEQSGFNQQALKKLHRSWREDSNNFLTISDMDKASQLRFFVLGNEKQPALMALTRGEINSHTLQVAADTVSGVSYFNPLQAIADSFEKSRTHAAWLVAGAYLVVLLVLIWRYGILGGLKTLSSPLLALGVTLGLLGLLGAPLNIFSVMALVMVLGIGLDYILFLREGEGHMQSTGVAVTLAALTSLLSFSFLAFSTIPALHTFGITVSLGMLLMYLAAPLALSFHKNNTDTE